MVSRSKSRRLERRRPSQSFTATWGTQEQGAVQSSFIVEGEATPGAMGGCFGYELHDQRLSKLRERFKFGKFKRLQELPEGTSFNGRRIQQDSDDFNVKVDMMKFVEERLSEVHLEKGRKSVPDSSATAEEVKRVRAAIGSFAWCAKEARPDAAAGASILASKMTKMKIKDIVALNKVIAQVKSKPGLTLQYHSIPFDDLRFGVATDASWDNYEDGSSQGAVGVLAYHKDLLEGKTAKCSLLWWKSGKLRRKVPSTLAAETQSLNRGLGELMWTKAIVQHLIDPEFELQEYFNKVKIQADLVLQKGDGDKTLRESLSID